MRRSHVVGHYRFPASHAEKFISRRRGLMAPAIIVGLLVVLLAVALVLDVWWADNASVELERTSESAALAAGRALVSDDLLRDIPRTPVDRRRQRARRAAIHMAQQNQVAGRPVRLDPHSQRDIRFGRLVHDADTGRTLLVKAPNRPTTVAVTTRRSRRNGNPLARFFRGITGRSDSEMSRTTEATVDNHVLGVRPFSGANVPMWPIAVAAETTVTGSNGKPLQGWRGQIEQRRGSDRFSYDERNRRVTHRPDGIPEMVLRCGDRTNAMQPTNVKLVDLGNGLQLPRLDRQMQHGVTARDLKSFGGQLRFDSRPLELTAYNDLPIGTRSRLAKQVGRCRILLLYSSFTPTNRNGLGRAKCPRLVAARVMAVRTLRDGTCEITIQPGTLITRTALLANPSLPPSQRRRFRNRYIYKLQVTR